MKKMNPVVHFEMPAEDKKRVSKFYEEAFGWHMTELGDEMDHYILATTTDSDEKGPKNPGAINGGFFDRKDDELNRAPHLVISVDNLKESMEVVTKAGGEVIGEPMDIPGIGTYATFKDTEKNVVGMLQPANPAAMQR